MKIKHIIPGIAAICTPMAAQAASYSETVSVTIKDVNAFIIEILLWFIFITVASFVTYFIVNTLLLISNNRRYRHLLHTPDAEKTELDKKIQKQALSSVKAAESRLGMLGVIIACFTVAYVLLSSYVYLGPHIREQMWRTIYIAVGVLTVLIIFYTIAWLFQRMRYNQLSSDDLERIRIDTTINTIKKRLKVFLIIVIVLILTYLVLLVTIARGVSQLSHR